MSPPAWSLARIPDLRDRLAVVTGANSGLGYQTALQLAAHGARTVLACRDPGRGQEALGRLRAAVPRAEAEVRPLDLADLASVAEFAAGLAGEAGLDILVNNAGVMAVPYQLTADGFEMQFGTSHLGHFALTRRLLALLLRRPGARVVTVSSLLARSGRIDFANLDGERGYNPHAAYGLAKLANQLFMLELDRRARDAGASLVSVAAHPGYAATNLQSRGPRMAGRRLLGLGYALGNRLFAQSDAAGAQPSLYAATAPEVAGGRYYGPGGRGNLRGRPALVATVPAAHDHGLARRLWDESEARTGVRYALDVTAKAD